MTSGVVFAACGGATQAGAASDVGTEAGDVASPMGEGDAGDGSGADGAAFDARSRIGPTHVLYCGDLNCEVPGLFCCLYDWPVCIVTGVMGGPESCPPGRSQLYCDDRTDCEPGSVCCATDTGSNGYAESICATSCATGPRSQILCNKQIPDPCPADRPICAEDPQAIFQGKDYCHASSPFVDAASAPDATATSDASVPITPCQALLQQDITGTYYASCRPRDLPSPFAFAVVQKMNPAGPPDTFDMTLSPLKIGAVNIFDTVGDTIVAPPATLAADCSFVQTIGTVTIPAQATALNLDLVVQEFVLRGRLQNAGQRCAEFDGTVPLIGLSAQGDGDVCVMTRVQGSDPLPPVSEADYVCSPVPAR